MFMLKKLLLLSSLIFFTLSYSDSEIEKDSSAKHAMNVLDSFMIAFNARDMNDWSETLNYPHVRFSGGNVKVWKDKQEYSAKSVFDSLVSTGWHHSNWLSREVVLESQNKVHISTVFQRYDKTIIQ